MSITNTTNEAAPVTEASRRQSKQWGDIMPHLWDRLSQGFSYLIILASVIMLGWGLLGFLEYFTGLAPLMPLQNSTFPVGMQTIHWILITASGATFLAGYFLRWSFTPVAMLVMFTALATMCAVQTFDMLETPDRYRNFVQECINYIVISVYLFRSRRMRDRFGRVTIEATNRPAPLSA